MLPIPKHDAIFLFYYLFCNRTCFPYFIVFSLIHLGKFLFEVYYNDREVPAICFSSKG
ncbi:hypothetical protein DAI22_01g403400 [Oryza sativa Japonica Group]|nr:hypothetical protein DAI22_01g403400 [Oryza sativa Japonica Group]